MRNALHAQAESARETERNAVHAQAESAGVPMCVWEREDKEKERDE
jgi:hypothetical protein